FAQLEAAYARMAHLTRDMSQDEVDYTGPEGAPNSTAMLIAHIARTDLEYLHLIMGREVPPELLEEYGRPNEDFTIPKVTGRTAADLVAAYGRVLELAREYLKTQTDADAVRPVRIPWWPEEASVRFVLWHMAGHCMLHLGQIYRLRAWYRGV
ncbi:MAG TPA: DinB family protein, partial [Symbiobacteriaceae bacterium]|nr:DinB family protein [Symbiobacteriaceae bacterium]